jgi:hypothetical protein
MNWDELVDVLHRRMNALRACVSEGRAAGVEDEELTPMVYGLWELTLLAHRFELPVTGLREVPSWPANYPEEIGVKFDDNGTPRDGGAEETDKAKDNEGYIGMMAVTSTDVAAKVVAEVLAIVSAERGTLEDIRHVAATLAAFVSETTGEPRVEVLKSLEKIAEKQTKPSPRGQA